MDSEATAKQPIDIFQYSSVGEYLKSYVDQKKKKNPAYSFRWLAKKLQLRSASQLTMIVRGEREPSPSLLIKLGEYFGFSVIEQNYLTAITGLRKANDRVQKQHYLSMIERYQIKNPELVLEIAKTKLLGSWYTYAIFSIVELDDFDGTVSALVRKLGNRVTYQQAEESLMLLLQLGLVTRLADGMLAITAENVRTTNNISDEAIQSHHQTMCDIAKSAIKEQSITERYYSSSMLAIPASKVDLAKRMMSEFRTRFIEEISHGPKEQVYHLGMQFFRISE